MKRLLTITSGILFFYTLYAQTTFYGEILGNYPFTMEFNKIETGKLSSPLSSDVDIKLTESYNTKVGLAATFGIEKQLWNKWYADIAIGLSLVNYARDATANINLPTGNSNTAPDFSHDLDYSPTGDDIFDSWDDIYNSDPINGDKPTNPSLDDNPPYDYPNQTLDNIGNTNILYFTIPLKLKYQIWKETLFINAGINNAFTIYSKQRLLDNDPLSDNFQKPYDDNTSNGLSNYLISGNIGAECKIIKSAWLTTTYEHYFTSIYDNEKQYAGKAKYRFLKFGIKYRFK